MEQLSITQLGPRIADYLLKHGNEWMTTAQMFEDGFADQDKVKFSLALSGMVLQKPHMMIKQDNPNGRGYQWRLRVPSDPPFVAPVKVPRKKVVEIGPVASPAEKPTPIPFPARPGNVAETPAEIRRHEPETRQVVHRTLTPPPPSTAMSTAVKAAFEARAPYTIPDTVKHVVAPFGSSGRGKAHGKSVLPKHEVAGTAHSTEPKQEVVPEHCESAVSAKLKMDAYDARLAAAAEREEVKPRAPVIGPVETADAYWARQRVKVADAELAHRMHEVRRKEAERKDAEQIAFDKRVKEEERVRVEARESMREFMANGPKSLPSQVIAVHNTPGALLDAFIAMAGPMFKKLITSAVAEAMTSPEVREILHAQVQTEATSQAHDEDSAVKIEVPPFVAPSSPDRHPFVMPGDVVERVRLPKVTIIGIPKTQHEHDVKDEFAKWLQIKTVNAGLNGRIARKHATGADHVLFLCPHNGHPMERSLIAGGVKYERINGGTVKVRERLREIIKSYEPVVESAEA